MADHKIFLDSSPKNPKLKTSPFDWTFVTNVTGKFGKVNCVMMKYVPPKTRLKIKPMFAFDMHPFVYPIQTNMRCHIKFFKVPLRILWKDFEDFIPQLGTDGLPVNSGSSQFVVPYIKRPTGWNAVGTLAEQIGCCNQRLVDYSELVNLSISPFRGSIMRIFNGNAIVPVRSNSSSSSNRFSILNLPEAHYVKNISAQSFNALTGQIRFTTLSNSVTLSSGSKIKVHVCTPGYDDALQRVQLPNGDFTDPSDWRHFNDGFYIQLTTEISNIVTAVAAFNNATVSSMMLRSTASSSGTISSRTVYERLVSFKIVDDTFFQIVKSLQAHGQNVVLIFEFEGGLADLLFPFGSIADGNLIVNQQEIYDKLDQNGDFSSSPSYVELVNKLGITGDVSISLARVVSEIDTKFDSVDGQDPEVPICALPFRALEFIHNYFGRNPRVDPFFKDGIPTYNRFITNDGSGADETTPVDSWNALYETDYFTSCVKEPQFGNAPLVGVTVNDTSDTGILTFRDDETREEYEVQLDIDTEGQVLPLTAYKESADRPNVHRLQELIKFGISINDLRNVSTFQRMLERLQRTSYRYANVIYEFFGTNPPIGDHFPEYIGGITRNVTVDKITNMALSDSASLGEFAGSGYFRYPAGNDKQRTITCFTSEPCYIVGIQYFTVTPCYSQYLPKHLLYKDPFDFYVNPEFAYAGPQPVRKIEIAPNQVTSENMYDVFGYNRPYAELFSNVDEVHGDFKTTMQPFLLQRFFGDAPELNKSFIEINADDLTNIFSVQTPEDKIFGQIMLNIHADLPAPRSYAPRSI